jgi:glyoxylase-like metal-dependent hydrolase (beta-lactamase superfamily II)
MARRNSGPDPLGDYLQSWRDTLELGAERLLPSHELAVEDPERRIHELLQHHDRRLQSCLEEFGSPAMTAYEISRQVFSTVLDGVGRNPLVPGTSGPSWITLENRRRR